VLPRTVPTKMVISSMKNKIAVIGAGSWGTAIALLLASKEYEVSLWGYDQEHIEQLLAERENTTYLPGFSLPANVYPTADINAAVAGCSLICMVVPSHGFRAVYEKVYERIADGDWVISAVKGIENGTMMTMSQVMEDVHKRSQNPKDVVTAILSGPSFAKEVAAGIPTAVTIGCRDLQKAAELQKIFVTRSFRVYASKDVIGLEISAALKNIIAIATGICDGLGYGLNTRAALITRGLAEITRLGLALGADVATFSGLSGLGDLVLTCTGSLSRNRSVGLRLGEGKKLDKILQEMNMVAEGIKTTESAFQLASKLSIEMPILEQVYLILYTGKSCSQAVRDLLDRELKVE
jgi:glycerol-3-phosphate dehydrogenase (NAD(P)+)